ncbi:hypothetical protein [Halodesulfovibrio spirochaetisodalis]|uniref:Holin of 3TMs, for gene-transfer release n=1 Tax=Halodesulfovibrio spirochaetisodalis TaxID=1560234 RepID=A0A1B7XER5_9BACT|nr:hypothetical protein [Halodesulfovibrio spirochaetisodalis]OBQ52675.1 hypothetical protein SP90_06810 [Halodesulfovibrio spirochaetisodalis]
MDWKDLGMSVAKVAPVLGAALGGPVGAIAGAAGTLISSFLGVEPEPQAVAAALNDPKVLVSLKKLEVEQQEQVMAWQRVQLEVELRNVQDARAREVALAKAGHGGAWVTGIVSLVVICGFFWMLREVVSAPQVSEPALLLLGSLGTAFGAVVNYYLGSSLGSYRKDKAGSGGNSGT